MTTARLSRPEPIQTRCRRVLDFDLETVAAGFADPNWCPNTVTAWACSWVDSEEVECGLLSPADFYSPERRRAFLEPLVRIIGEADILTGHNIVRFDLPVLNADLMRVGLPRLAPTLVQDTIRLPKSKGFKKGQDVLSDLLGVEREKLSLNWQSWAEAYGEEGMATIKARVVGDVLQHKQLRLRMMERGWLEAPRMWR